MLDVPVLFKGFGRERSGTSAVISFIFPMADADSDGHDLTFSEPKNPKREGLKGKRKGTDYFIAFVFVCVAILF